MDLDHRGDQGVDALGEEHRLAGGRAEDAVHGKLVGRSGVTGRAGPLLGQEQSVGVRGRGRARVGRY